MLAEVLDRDERVDVVIIDTAAGLTPEIIRYGEEADSVLVVTTPEPTAVMDAYAMIKILGLNAPGQLVELVINNARSDPGRRRDVHEDPCSDPSFPRPRSGVCRDRAGGPAVRVKRSATSRRS